MIYIICVKCVDHLVSSKVTMIHDNSYYQRRRKETWYETNKNNKKKVEIIFFVAAEKNKASIRDEKSEEGCTQQGEAKLEMKE